MDTIKQIQFVKQFENIKFHIGLIKQKTDKIKTLTSWDKNDSHKEALAIVMNDRDELKVKLQDLLKGASYEEWKDINSKLTRYKLQLKNALEKAKDAEEKLKTLKFLEY